MDIRDLISEAAVKLKAAGIENYANEARWLVQESAGCRAFFSSGDELAPEREKIARLAIERRCRREPLQYILGSAPFGELELLVSPAVLVPRPETEVLVACALAQLEHGGSLLDLGCGSGAIALLSASRRPEIRVTAVDNSPEALAVAITNARNLALNKRIDFRESDLFSALAGERFSLIAANLPYVSESEYLTLEPEVRCFEPECALTAPEEGFALIRQAINSCSTHLLPGGKVIFEMSPRQIPAALELLEAQNFTAKVVADQFGEQRFAFGVLG